MFLKKQSIFSIVLLSASILIGVGTVLADDVVSSGDVREALVTADNGNTNTDETVGDTVIGEGNDTTDSSSATTDESEVLPSENSVESSLENSDMALGDDSSKGNDVSTEAETSITTGANSDVTANTSGVSEPNVSEQRSESNTDVADSSTTESDLSSVFENSTVSSSASDKQFFSEDTSKNDTVQQNVLPETGDGINLKKIILGTITVIIAVYLALGDKIKAFFVDLLADDEEDK
ncbi:hypothetical protein [Streptococcus mutans]|uniref:hypothetical protein n=1 Tax=Streptococcus mutans TaxID=1309 RepID=UPI0002B545C6|nr:hypothetical protein [Streptococcus mutans]EMC35135.1 hypothetical protein SMU93_08688 [Streptococcus mutans 21]